MEKEALFLESLDMALAAHNSGGLVMVQVERLAAVKSLNPRPLVSQICPIGWVTSGYPKLAPKMNECTLKRDYFKKENSLPTRIFSGSM